MIREKYKWTDKKLLALCKDMTQWMNKSDENIFFQEYLSKKGIFNSFICDYTKRSEVFKNGIKKVREQQKFKLMRLGLFQKTQATLTMFLLKCTHGMRDDIISRESLQNLSDYEIDVFLKLYQKAME